MWPVFVCLSRENWGELRMYWLPGRTWPWVREALEGELSGVPVSPKRKITTHFGGPGNTEGLKEESGRFDSLIIKEDIWMAKHINKVSRWIADSENTVQRICTEIFRNWIENRAGRSCWQMSKFKRPTNTWKRAHAQWRENRNPAPVYIFVNVQNIKGVVTLAAAGNRRERVSTQGW